MILNIRGMSIIANLLLGEGNNDNLHFALLVNSTPSVYPLIVKVSMISI